MHSNPEKETLALNSLHDISEYTHHIDRKILKLGQLYQSLDMSNNKLPAQQLSELGRANSKLYSTARQSFSHTQKPPRDIKIESFYTTQVQLKFMRKKRYERERDNANCKACTDLKSKYKSFDRTESPFSTVKTNIRTIEQKGKQYKLNLYENVKREIMGTFYVGSGNGSGTSRKRQSSLFRHSDYFDNGPKLRKGKLWQGRPPVKIIQKID